MCMSSERCGRRSAATGESLPAYGPTTWRRSSSGEVVRRAGVDPSTIDEVALGAANQAGEDNRNVARMAVLLAGLPDHVPGYTVNRLCASGLTAVVSAAQAIGAGHADVVVAGGVESMTRAPWVMARPEHPYAAPGELADTALGWRLVNPRMPDLDGGEATISLGRTAEKVAQLDGITREESDAYALRSQQRAVAAQQAGHFADELLPVPVRGGAVETDECPRADTDANKLAALKPVFDGIVTAGSASSLADGAAALVLASEAAVHRQGLSPLARVVAAASAGVAPSVMGLGPVPATEKALARAGWTVPTLDAVELNEAFAPQVLACVRRLGLDLDIVNSDGGAIALGHPLGCSGTRLVVTLLGRMARESARRGLATLCVGVGQGVSLLLERP
jgi:acetyl-CoA acetyltransferase family protein